MILYKAEVFIPVFMVVTADFSVLIRRDDNLHVRVVSIEMLINAKAIITSIHTDCIGLYFCLFKQWFNHGIIVDEAVRESTAMDDMPIINKKV